MSYSLSSILRPALRSLEAHHPAASRALLEEVKVFRDTDLDCLTFDVAEAVWYLSTMWHGGQWCPLYAMGCAVGFSPGAMATRPDSPVACLIYNAVDAELAVIAGVDPTPYPLDGGEVVV